MYKVARTFVFGISLFMLGILQLSAAEYPTPLPDFSHRLNPHFPLYSFTGGSLDRPLLVIYRQFTGVTPAANRDSAWASQFFFGVPFPSLSGYYRWNSGGRLDISPAQESEGTVNDGIVVVNTGITGDDFWALSTGDQRKTGLEGADPFVNFASFDSNGDGVVTNEELLVVQMHVARDPSENCGQSDGNSPVILDGKQISLSIAQGTEITNLITHIHEVGHIALSIIDYYGYGAGALDISGPTCGRPDDTFFSFNGYQKMHLGWIAPTVVTKDGFYEIFDAAVSGDAYILYDYDRGTDDFFIIENRQSSSIIPYDRSVSDDGLVIWRIDEAVYNNSDPNIRMIEIMRTDGVSPHDCTNGCYDGTNGDAWDPSDLATPERTMDRNWRDGSPSQVAVRAISKSGINMRAYFDVRGPGVLVDPSTATGEPMEITAVPEETSVITFPVMNTGEVPDGFDFTILGTPGWVMSSQHLELDPGVPATASINLIIPADAVAGVYDLNALGVSDLVLTSSPLTVVITLHETSIDYIGDSSVQWGSVANLRAQLIDIHDPSDPVSGATVTFKISNGFFSVSEGTSSTSDGAAEVAPFINLPPGLYELAINSQRQGKHDESQLILPFTVLSLMQSIDSNAPNLEAILPTGDSKADKQIMKAITDIEKSLTPEWWLDGLTLDPKDGKKVFDNLFKAVHELTKKQVEEIPEVQAVVDTLVSTAETLAQKAIDDATAAGGSIKEINKANDEMVKASEELSKGNFDTAIHHYRKAWEKAQKSL